MTDVTAPPEGAWSSTMERLEALKRVSQKGTDYWRAREIFPVLGYAWRRFQDVIERAMEACEGVGVTARNHFAATGKMVELGSGATRGVQDYFLSRVACYLIAMNGDPSKPEIAAAQAYFTIQTRRMELRDQADAALAEDERRLELRERVRTSFKKVSGVAQDAGVRSETQALFHDARYQGLYGMGLKAVRQKKGIRENESIFDRAGPLELSANDFQMNLAADVLVRERVHGEQRAIDTNRDVGRRVRNVMRDSGSPAPEELPAAEPIKLIENRMKQKKIFPKPID